MFKWIISLALNIVPRHQLHKIAHICLKMVSPFLRGQNFTDPISGISYRRLLPYGRKQSRPNVLAPDSLSLERHRLCWLYMQRKTNFFTAPIKFLHLAPEYCFLQLFKSQKNLDYITADLNSPWASMHFDVHEIPFEDNVFDVLMANHLLEHVNDDRKVMREFYRVLKPGGWAIFMIPQDIHSAVTLEDPTITSPEEREKHYWQSDHLRLYGLDFKDRLTSAGFQVTVEDYTKEFTTEQIKAFALNPNELIYYCKK